MQIIHTWTETEEKMLIAVYIDMEDSFNGIKNHDTIWNEITRKLNSEGVPVAKNQVINKWKYMKKKYKEIVDNSNKTGSSTMYWKHYESFNQLYGNKASTEPAMTIDTSRNIINVAQVCDSESTNESNNESGPSGNKKRKKDKSSSKTDQVTTMVREIQASNSLLLQELKDEHNSRMQRMDRFLEIYSKQVDINK